MEETHNYAMNLVVPLMGIAPLLMVFILKGEKKQNEPKDGASLLIRFIREKLK